MIVIALILGLALGALGAWLYARGEVARREGQLATAQGQLASSLERLALVERTDTQWDEKLKALTHDALETSSSSLMRLAEAKLKPISETLDRFERQAKELEEKRLKDVTSIGATLTSVAQGQERLRKETGNLVTALRAPHVRGRWGEVQLKRVVEMAGMLAYCDFDEQPSQRDEDGQLRRPDLVIKLAGGKHIVVDAKTPLDAYLDAAETDDDDKRREHLVRHARLVREHMMKLGHKRYWQQFEPAPEFVIMFLGDEAFFRAALDHDPSLLVAGVEAKVVIASPTTLIAMLLTVAHAWQQEAATENVREVNRLGRELYERLGVFVGHFVKVGRSIDATAAAFNQTVGSLETRVLVTARKFPEHGIAGDDLPEVAPIERQTRAFVAAELTGGEPVRELPTRAVDAA